MKIRNIIWRYTTPVFAAIILAGAANAQAVVVNPVITPVINPVVNSVVNAVVHPVVNAVVTSTVNPIINANVNAVVNPIVNSTVNPIVTATVTQDINVNPDVNVNVNVNIAYPDMTEGKWFAMIKGDKLNIEFRSGDSDSDHYSSSNKTFSLSEFPKPAKGRKRRFFIKKRGRHYTLF